MLCRHLWEDWYKKCLDFASRNGGFEGVVKANSPSLDVSNIIRRSSSSVTAARPRFRLAPHGHVVGEELRAVVEKFLEQVGAGLEWSINVLQGEIVSSQLVELGSSWRSSGV